MGSDRRLVAARAGHRDARGRRQPPEPRSRDPRPEIKKLVEFFDGAGWHVDRGEVRLAHERSLRPRGGGAAARPHRRDVERGVPVRCSPSTARSCATGSSTARTPVRGARRPARRRRAERLVTNLGGHDLGVLLDAYRACDEVTDRPSVVFAYTVKGWGLPMAGDPMNHAALLTADQIDGSAHRVGARPGHGVGPLHPTGRRRPGVCRDRWRAQRTNRVRATAPPYRCRRDGRRSRLARSDAGDVRSGADPPRRRRRRSPNGSSPRHPTCASRPTSAAGSTRWVCSRRTTGPTTSAADRLLRWQQSPPATTSSSASAR